MPERKAGRCPFCGAAIAGVIRICGPCRRAAAANAAARWSPTDPLPKPQKPAEPKTGPIRVVVIGEDNSNESTDCLPMGASSLYGLMLDNLPMAVKNRYLRRGRSKKEKLPLVREIRLYDNERFGGGAFALFTCRRGEDPEQSQWRWAHQGSVNGSVVNGAVEEFLGRERYSELFDRRYTIAAGWWNSPPRPAIGGAYRQGKSLGMTLEDRNARLEQEYLSSVPIFNALIRNPARPDPVPIADITNLRKRKLRF